jgi:predicted DNA-binding antitoxin AbrB/MazE fold protein
VDEEDIEKILQQKVDLKDGDEDDVDVDKKINDALKKEKV